MAKMAARVAKAVKDNLAGQDLLETTLRTICSIARTAVVLAAEGSRVRRVKLVPLGGTEGTVGRWFCKVR